MTGAARDAAGFLRAAGWQDAVSRPLAGDASARSYRRLTLGTQRAVLMDAPPAAGQDTRRFVRVADWLLAQGYSAPRLLQADHDAGFLLLEDLGDGLFARLLDAEPGREADLYPAATEFLVDLHRHPAATFLATLDGPTLGAMTDLVLLWYLPGCGEGDSAEAGMIAGLIARAHARLCHAGPVTCLRDFHAENLVWLADRPMPGRVGLLDFQDAVAADPAYDLVSLLQDARREVPAVTEAREITRYCAAKGLDQTRFSAVYALIGAQRNLRILGVFARLAMQSGKPRYLDFMPRVWGYLERDLAHPNLAELARAVRDTIPEPTPARVQRILDRCGQSPTP
ncbi:MAG: aminoglycoside phosphotransferase [Alphaproteobacteria bacterium HGW-Alphaproteobacteria-6]|nr:MAG: aminoglycoside phosphotransferase [Alphaproteobacteria bacterium HGW-Alphaproteobacteria-6]